MFNLFQINSHLSWFQYNCKKKSFIKTIIINSETCIQNVTNDQMVRIKLTIPLHGYFKIKLNKINLKKKKKPLFFPVQDACYFAQFHSFLFQAKNGTGKTSPFHSIFFLYSKKRVTIKSKKQKKTEKYQS